MVIAHAHIDETSTAIDRDRALARLSAITSQLRRAGVDNPAELPERTWRRYLRAQVACGMAMRAHFVAAERHSRWYRAFLRSRRWPRG